MDVSVIVVTYNQEATIGRTLESILSQQTDAEYEIVIGDDASTDGTEAICRAYAARYPTQIVYLRRERNMGVTANYFDCIAHARGRYLADCAGDDYWTDPRKLQMQVSVMEEDPTVSLVATDWLHRDEKEGRLYRTEVNPEVIARKEYQPGTLGEAIICSQAGLHLCTALYRKDIIDRAVQGNRDMFVNPEYSCEDQQILLEMARAGRIVVLPCVTLHYSVGHPSISHQTDYSRKFEYSLRAFRQTLALERFFGIQGPSVALMHSVRLNHIAAMALRAGYEPTAPTTDTRTARLHRFLNETGLPLPLKARLYMTLMRLPSVWKLINRLRK